METDDDGVPKMDFEVAQKYYGQMRQGAYSFLVHIIPLSTKYTLQLYGKI